MKRFALSILIGSVAAGISCLAAPEGVQTPENSAAAPAGERGLSLEGTWRFQMDRADAGIREKWFERDLEGKILLPGALQSQGFGDQVRVDTQWTGDIVDRSWFTAPQYEKYRQPGKVKVPFWLQPDRHYTGAAWYQREVAVPEARRGALPAPGGNVGSRERSVGIPGGIGCDRRAAEKLA